MEQWCPTAIGSCVAVLQQFAKRLSAYVEGIVASAVYSMNTSVLEGMNNRINVIKPQACGFRNSDYFFIKVKATFPGNVKCIFSVFGSAGRLLDFLPACAGHDCCDQETD